jgi:hypothetical protein
MRRRHLGVAVALVTLLALGACASESTPGDNAPSASLGPEAAPGPEATRPRVQAERGEPVAVLGDPTSSGGSIEIHSLTRDSEQLVTLRFSLVNEGTDSVDVANRFGGVGSRSMEGVYLVDPDGLKKYLTVLDGDDRCLCSTNLFNVESGERLDLFATFAAPPPAVTSLTVVVPSFEPANGIPVE